MVQKIKLNDFIAIRGMGRVDDTRPIDLREYVFCQSESISRTPIPVMAIPKQIRLSKKIGKTVYDVTADFDLKGKKTILQQFKDLILSTNL